MQFVKPEYLAEQAARRKSMDFEAIKAVLRRVIRAPIQTGDEKTGNSQRFLLPMGEG